MKNALCSGGIKMMKDGQFDLECTVWFTELAKQNALDVDGSLRKYQLISGVVAVSLIGENWRNVKKRRKI